MAEELAQEAFERLWRRWRWIRDPDAAPAHLHRTVVNLGNSAIRRHVLERRVAAIGGQSVDAGPEASIELRQAIAALSPRRRACVVLRYLADMTGVADGANPRDHAWHGQEPDVQGIAAASPAAGRTGSRGRADSRSGR